jgi:hypothetical protein
MINGATEQRERVKNMTLETDACGDLWNGYFDCWRRGIPVFLARVVNSGRTVTLHLAYRWRRCRSEGILLGRWHVWLFKVDSISNLSANTDR